MKYLEINKFRNKVADIRGKIHELIYQDLLTKYQGKYAVSRNNILITVLYRGDKGQEISILDPRVLGVTLDEDNPVDIYQSTRELSVGGTVALDCTIVFNIVDVNNGNTDVLELGDREVTFDTYDNFLRLVHEKTKCIEVGKESSKDVRLLDKHTKISLFQLFNQLSPKQKTPVIPFNLLSNWVSYQKVDKDTKEKVDALLCPFTLTKKDVKMMYLGDMVIVTLDKGELMRENFRVQQFNAIVVKELTD